MSSPTYNLARFDFVSIRLAVLCGQTGSLTTAARQCHLVLAAASRRIKELETATGSQLFERHSRGLSVTPAGRVFMRHGLAVLQEMDNLVANLTDLQHGVVRHLRLCAGTAAINQFLPPLLAKYAVLHPDIQIDLEEQVSEQVVQSLREGRADVGVFVEGPDTYGLEVKDFRQDELVLILPRVHPLAGTVPVLFSDTLDESWISLSAGAALLQQQQSAAMAAGRPLKLRMQVRSFDAVGHMVASGLGIALLPKAAALPMVRSLKLGWCPLKDAWAQRRMLVAIRKETDPMVSAFRDFLNSSSPNAKSDLPRKK
jgi:DNA-binding transcriptional LysR family regulator